MAEQFNICKSDIVLLIGSTLAIVGIFVTWADITVTSEYYSETIGLSGWNFVSDGIASEKPMFYAPLILMVLSVSTYTSLILKRMIPRYVTEVYAAIGILSIVGFAMTVLFSFELTTLTEELEQIGSFVPVDYCIGSGIGIYMGLVSGLLTIAGCALSMGESESKTESPETEKPCEIDLTEDSF